MGYDLLEDSEFFPLSRVKSNFTDDVNYRDFLGIGRGRKRARGEGAKVDEMFPDLSDKNSCQEIENRILEIQSEMDIQRGKITAGDKSKWFRISLGRLESKLASAKALFNKKKCQEIADEQELKRQQGEIISTLTETSTATTSNREKKSGTIAGINKYLVYGLGGVFVLGALFIILKPSNE